MSDQPEFEPRFMTLLGAVIEMDPWLTLDPMYAQEHDVILVTRTGEMVQVRSVDGPKVTVTRGLGGTVAVPMVDGDELLIVGSSNPPYR